MDRLVVLALVVGLMAAPLAGCASQDGESGATVGGESKQSSGSSYQYSAGGSQAAEDDQGTFQAPNGEASLSASVGGSGRLTVSVQDAGGSTVFEETYTGSGGSSTSDQLSGQAGQWTVEVQVDYWSGGFSLNADGA